MAGGGQAIQEKPAVPSFWGGKMSDKGLGYGWNVGGKKVNTQSSKPAAAKAKPNYRPGTFTPMESSVKAPKKLFGGTNKLMAGVGQQIQESPATPGYWGGKKSEKDVGYGWFSKKR